MRIMKILLCGLLLALPVFAEEADDRKTATSLKYVTHELDTRQNKLQTGTNKALTYTNAAGGVAQREVKTTLSGGTTDTSLPTVGAVNTGLAQKQDDIEPINDHTAVTYTGQTGEIGEKGIYQTDGTYSEQSNALIDAKTFNAALKNGLDSEFVCDEDNRQPGTNTCWLWKIHNTVTTDEYTRMEYIEGTGTQWIDTGINIGENIQTDVRFGKTANSFTRFGFVIGGGANYQGLVTRLQSAGGNNYYVSMYNSSTNTEGFNINEDVFDCSFNQVGHMVTCDDQTRQLTPISPYPTTGTIGIFQTPIASTTNNVGIGRVYMFKITNHTTNEVLFNGIPAVRNSDNAVGMYDTVSGEFFENNGTDTFGRGPVVYIPQNQ